MIKTYEDWENSLDQNYVNQLDPDAWDLTGSAFEAGQQSQQAKIDELQAKYDELNNRATGIALDQMTTAKLNYDLQARIDKAIERAGHAHIGYPMLSRQFGDVLKILKGNKDEN